MIITLYTAKPSNLKCKIVKPEGIIIDKNRKKIDIKTHIWASYVSRIFDHIKDMEMSGEGYDIINNHDDPIAFVLGRQLNLGYKIITTLHGSAGDASLSIFPLYPKENFSAVSKSHMLSYKNYNKNMNFLGFVYNSISKNHPFSKNKRNYLFSVSRIQPDKGQKNAIEIAKEAGLDLIIAGNIMDSDYFDKEIRPHITKDLSIPNKKEERNEFIWNLGKYQPAGDFPYVGEVTERERDQIMKHAKVALFPIEREEPFGLTFIEAGIVGTPVIASNRGAVSEIVEQGKTGFYGNSINELVDYVKVIDKISPHDCRKHIETNFNPDKMVEGYIELYKKVIDNTKR